MQTTRRLLLTAWGISATHTSLMNPSQWGRWWRALQWDCEFGGTTRGIVKRQPVIPDNKYLLEHRLLQSGSLPVRPKPRLNNVNAWRAARGNKQNNTAAQFACRAQTRRRHLCSSSASALASYCTYAKLGSPGPVPLLKIAAEERRAAPCSPPEESKLRLQNRPPLIDTPTNSAWPLPLDRSCGGRLLPARITSHKDKTKPLLSFITHSLQPAWANYGLGGGGNNSSLRWICHILCTCLKKNYYFFFFKWQVFSHFHLFTRLFGLL